MADSKRPPKQSSRGNPPPPPPRRQNGKEKSRRENDRHSSGGGAGRSVATKSMAGKSTNSRSSRARETSTGQTNHHRSKSRPKDSPRNSRSRSKSRPREATKGKENNHRDGGSRSKPDARDEKSRSRSKSRPRQSPSSSKPQSSSRSSPNKQHQSSKKSSNNKPKNKSRDQQQNGTRSSSSLKRQPSAKKRDKFAANAKRAIPASVRMISGSHDSQTSADVSNISSQFQLPNPAGRSGGACTAALLQVLYQSHEYGMDDITWVDVLRQMRDVLDDKGFDQIPQLTSSRMIDVHDPFVITPTDGSFSHKNNTQRAVLIGINYTGQSGQLSGCHNDVHNVSKYLTEVQGFRKENVTILMDDGNHKPPTKSAILSAYKRLVRESREGDVVFCHYSGHGGRLPDDNGDEEDGYDETLIPVDFNKSGQIRDDDLLKILVHPMPAGVTMTCLMDCCHSGTVLDLPYRFTADGDLEEMEINERTNFKDAVWAGAGLAVGMAAGNAVVGAVAGAVASAVTPQPEMMILGGGPNAIHEYSDTDCCVVM